MHHKGDKTNLAYYCWPFPTGGSGVSWCQSPTRGYLIYKQRLRATSLVTLQLGIWKKEPHVNLNDLKSESKIGKSLILGSIVSNYTSYICMDDSFIKSSGFGYSFLRHIPTYTILFFFFQLFQSIIRVTPVLPDKV